MPFGRSRRSFVASVVAASALAGSGGAAIAQSGPDATASPRAAGTVPFTFDRLAFQSVLDRPYPHRQIAAPASFSAATIAMSHFRNALAAYADPNGFAAGPNALHCAVALYGGRSINLVLDDAMYAKYPLGLMNDEEMRPTDTTYRSMWRAMRANSMTSYLRPLIDQGMSFFVCNNALSSFAFDLARRVAPSPDAVTREQVVAIHDELADHFMPGSLLVPAGVAALNAAQEARFTFLP
jgi:intracellular sulfur oxidation DsrE/DsrF family protein